MVCTCVAVDNGRQSSNISTCGGNVKTRKTKLELNTNKISSSGEHTEIRLRRWWSMMVRLYGWSREAWDGQYAATAVTIERDCAVSIYQQNLKERFRLIVVCIRMGCLMTSFIQFSSLWYNALHIFNIYSDPLYKLFKLLKKKWKIEQKYLSSALIKFKEKLLMSQP